MSSIISSNHKEDSQVMCYNIPDWGRTAKALAVPGLGVSCSSAAKVTDLGPGDTKLSMTTCQLKSMAVVPLLVKGNLQV